MRSHASVNASHNCVPQRAVYEKLAATGCHGSAADTRIVSVLTCEEIFAEAQACTEAGRAPWAVRRPLPMRAPQAGGRGGGGAVCPR